MCRWPLILNRDVLPEEKYVFQLMVGQAWTTNLQVILELNYSNLKVLLESEPIKSWIQLYNILWQHLRIPGPHHFSRPVCLISTLPLCFSSKGNKDSMNELFIPGLLVALSTVTYNTTWLNLQGVIFPASLLGIIHTDACFAWHALANILEEIFSSFCGIVILQSHFAFIFLSINGFKRLSVSLKHKFFF